MYARLIQTWQQLGYRAKLIYLSLPNPEIDRSRGSQTALRRAVILYLSR